MAYVKLWLALAVINGPSLVTCLIALAEQVRHTNILLAVALKMFACLFRAVTCKEGEDNGGNIGLLFNVFLIVCNWKKKKTCDRL